MFDCRLSGMSFFENESGNGIENNFDWIDYVQESAILLSDVIIKQLEPIRCAMATSKVFQKYLNLDFPVREL